MDAHLDTHRLPIRTHQARVAELAPPARVRTVADPTWRHAVDAVARAARTTARSVRRILVAPGPEPVRGATPAMLGRHPRPEAPSTCP
jgi:hypothetical protein